MLFLFRKLWAIYGGILFFVMLLISFPFIVLGFLLFGEKSAKPILWYAHQIFSPIYLILTLIRVRTHGREQVDFSRQFVVISNHTSSVDFLINARVHPKAAKWLAKKELERVPLLGFIIKNIVLSVDRASHASRRASMGKLNASMQAGFSIFVYPEGTRNKSDELLGSFKKGAFRIAEGTDKPILIQTSVNMANVSNYKNDPDLCPGFVDIFFDVVESGGKTTRELLEECRAIMHSRIADYRADKAS